MISEPVNFGKLIERNLDDISPMQPQTYCWSGLFGRKRSWNYSPFSSHILQIFVKVSFIINTHEVSTLLTSLDRPREVVLEEQFPLFLIESSRSPNDRHHTHWKVHLLKLYYFECWLTNQVGWKIKEGVP